MLKKFHQVKVTTAEKSALIEQITNHTTAQTQQICAKALDIPVIQPQSIKTQKDDSRVVSFTFSKEQFAKFEMLRDFLVHKNFQKKRTQQMQNVLETMFDELIKTNDLESESESESESELAPESQSESERSRVATKDITECVTEMVATRNVTASESTALEERRSKEVSGLQGCWKSLTPKRKKLIRQKDQVCQYTDHKTGRTCGSRFNLHIDHIQSKWAGGLNDPQNLRVLCRQHNLYRERGSLGF